MHHKELDAAIAEAERFLMLAKKLKASIKTSDGYSIYSAAASGATKRASMDLTRALAVYRNPYRYK